MCVGQCHLAWKASSEVTTAYTSRECLRERNDCTDCNFYIFSSTFTNTKFKFVSHKFNDVFIETVASDVRTLRCDDTLKCNDGDIGCTATDVKYHRTDRFANRQFRANGTRNSLFHNKRFACASVF